MIFPSIIQPYLSRWYVSVYILRISSFNVIRICNFVPTQRLRQKRQQPIRQKHFILSQHLLEAPSKLDFLVVDVRRCQRRCLLLFCLRGSFSFNHFVDEIAFRCFYHAPLYWLLYPSVLSYFKRTATEHNYLCININKSVAKDTHLDEIKRRMWFVV